MRGGYQLLNLKNIDLTNDVESDPIKGVYEAVKNSNRKRVVVTGLYLDGTGYSDIETYFVRGVGVYQAVSRIGASTLTITVSEDDTVLCELV